MIKDCDFRKSIARKEGLNILNENKMRIFSSRFIENQDILISINNIFNYGSLEVFDCIFEDNFLDSAIFNNEDANLSVSDSRFTTNFSNKSLIYNLSENCSLINLVFDNNESKEDFKANIYNKGHLLLSNPKVKNIHKKNIYNDGTIDIRKASQDFIDQNIYTPGVINLLTLFKEDLAKKENESNFSKLDDLIHSSDDLNISLEDDYILDFYELGFYEGGIELDIDNLHINGNGRTIDGNNRSRIFLISGKNIVLENIRFKNGNFKSISEHANGGGVLRTLNGSSLILRNCEFLDNKSDDDGGAIFNRGIIKSVNSSFNNNLSKLYGACIFNSGEYISIEDDFNINLSKLGYQIYNQGELILDNSELSDISDFSVESFANDLSFNLEDRLPIDSKAIFNNGVIRDISLDNSDFIFNVGTIDDEADLDYGADDLISIVSDRQTQLSKNNLSITDFISKIQSSDEMGLDGDVIFDFNRDNGIYKEIKIENDMVIDGQGHSIDACGISLMFNILSNNVVFKNLTFKNIRLLGNPLFNIESSLSLENCKFENIKSSNEDLFLNNGELNVSDSNFLNNDLEDAAIFDNKSNLEISNSIFLNNSSLISLVFNGNDSSGLLRISNNVFFDNDITNQSSILNHLGKMSIDDSKFKYNSSNKGGGAIVNCSNGELDISDSDFIDNSAEYGGALSNLGNMNVLGSSFKRNSVKQNMGGAISNSGHITVDNSFFRENYAKVIGSAINSSGGVLIVKNSKFYENKSDNPGFISIKEGSGYQLEANEAENNLPEDTAFLLK